MDGKGRALDNMFAERLWRSVNYEVSNLRSKLAEEVYLNDYENPRAARQGLRRYLHFYNHERVHQALNYKTPAEAYC
jgi:putative transposase